MCPLYKFIELSKEHKVGDTAETGTSVAMSTYYKRLWAYFSVKLLVNIGSCGLRFYGLFSKV